MYQEKKGVKGGDHVTPYPYYLRKEIAVPVQTDPINHPNFWDGLDAGNVYGGHLLGENSGPGSWAQPGINKAYAKLKSGLTGESASLGAFVGELGESCNMIAKRAIQLRQAYRSARRFDIAELAMVLGVTRKRRHRGMDASKAAKQYANDASGLWLEYSFGWKPMLGDMYNAAKVMTSEPPSGVQATGSGFSRFFEPREHGWYGTQHNYRCFTKMGATAYIENPNKFLLNQLGLANPVAIAWELIPFSFMVDWVFDVGSFIESFTDFYGLRIERPYTTHFLKGDTSYLDIWNPAVGLREMRGHVVVVSRRPRLERPLPNAGFTANIGQSLNRTANAVSLLTQILTRR